MLKIMTLNINYDGSKHGAWAMRRRLIADAITQRQPDVVVLQAVRADPRLAPHANQAQQLGALLPSFRDVIFEPALWHDDDRADGGAILSRLPILDRACRRLSTVANDEDMSPRLLLTARVAADSATVSVVNGHFSWVPVVNRENTAETLAYLDALPAPVIFAGDLNARPDSDTLRRFASAGWIDAWARVRPREAGYTFEAGDPTQRIDYFWVDAAWGERIRSVDLVEAPPGAIRLSDHVGLLLTLSP